MKRTSFVIGLLLALLFGSNVWWAARVLDSGISFTYLEASCETESELLSQAEALVELMLQTANVGRAEAVAAIAAASGDDPAAAYEKDGFHWVGQYGLRFDSDDKLVGRFTGWSDDPG